MDKNKVRVRFAPSPTGSLHVGNARTALYNWLFARHNQGSLILRIEDTDQERTLPVHTKSLIAELGWLGITWDEGPNVGGAYGPYNQMERLEIYQGYLQKLINKGIVYRCYCTEAELEEERSMLIATHQPPRYLGKCRNLTSAQRQELEAQGRKAAWRFRVGGGEVTFNDLIRGKLSFATQAIGDFIVVRSNGVPAYNFAAVIDDALMEISHVIRGEDHLSNTALQLLLYRELGWTPPYFAHHSLILGKDRAKLSKRHGAVAIGEFRRLGFLPEALTNYFALCGAALNTAAGETVGKAAGMLVTGSEGIADDDAGVGKSDGENKEIYTSSELVRLFSLDKLGKAGAVFDEEKLRWVNSQWLRRQDDTILAELIAPLAEEVFAAPPTTRWLEVFCAAFKENLVLLADAREYLTIFRDETFHLSVKAREILGNAGAQQLLGSLRFILENEPEPLNYENIVGKMKQAASVKGKALFLPMRAALTGTTEGIELNKLFALLSKASLLFRLHKAMS